jgi:hypothetical protein
MRNAILLISLILLPQLVAAQTSSDFENLPIPTWAEPVIDSFGKPVHPVIGSVASGGGLGFGVGYDPDDDDERWYRSAEAMVSIRRYWSLAGEIGRRSMTKRSQLGVFGAVRHMNRLDYFGIGPNTIFDDRSAFRLRETAIGTRGWIRPFSAARVGGSVTMYKPDLGPGANRRVPSIEERFAASSVPGFSAEPMFGRYRGFAELLYPVLPAPDERTRNEEPSGYRTAFQIAVEAFRDYDSGRHDFHRWETEVQQRIPGFRPGQRLTLHGFLATTNSGSDVPFYMLYTLGGSSGLKSFRPDLFGTDGTRATLRSFKNFRFRDRDLVLMQAEYRIPLVSGVHATVFVDAGQVAPDTSTLFKNFRTGTGFSLGYMRKGRSLGRVDVGFGGGEGVQLFWSFSAFEN